MPLTPHQAQYIAHDLTLQHAGAGSAAWPQSESETVKAKPEQAYANRQPEIHHGVRDEFREIARLFAASFERHSVILKTTKETSKTAKETTKETTKEIGTTGLETTPQTDATTPETPVTTLEVGPETVRKPQENTKERLLQLLREQPHLSTPAMALVLGKGIDGTKYRLNRLKQAGQVRHVGPSKGGHWQVTEPDTQGTI